MKHGLFVLCSDKEFKEAEKGMRALEQQMKSKCLMFRLTRWRQDWLVAQKNSNQDDYILLPGSGPEFRFIVARFSVAGCLADWQMLGGCLRSAASARTSSLPLSAPGCRGVGSMGVGRVSSFAHKPSEPGVGRCQRNDESARPLAVGPSVISELRLNSH